MAEEVPVVEVMEWRNPVYNQVGTINCEANDPVHGWLEFTASPDDTEEAGRLVYADIIASGVAVGPYVPPPIEEQRHWMMSLSKLQMRMGLLEHGVDSAKLDETINALPAEEREKASITFNYADWFTRLDPSVIVVLSALGMSDTQIDEFWNKALTK